MSDDPTSDAQTDVQTAAAIARVRRLMLIVTVTTVIAVGLVFVAIGYRVSQWHGSTPAAPSKPPDVTASLPEGAKVLSSAVGDGHIVLTVEVDGAIELRTFDLNTLKPLGRLRFTPSKEP